MARGEEREALLDSQIAGICRQPKINVLYMTRTEEETTKKTDSVVIIGGGPAGAAVGCYLSKAGIKNTIFEAANHPRAHVGESMVMSSVRVFDEIGFLPVMEREGFIR